MEVDDDQVIWANLPQDVLDLIFHDLGPGGAQMLAETSRGFWKAYRAYGARRVDILAHELAPKYTIPVPFVSSEVKVLGGREGWMVELIDSNIETQTGSWDTAPWQYLRIWHAGAPERKPREVCLPRLRFGRVESTVSISPDGTCLLIESHPCRRSFLVIELPSLRIHELTGRFFRCAKFVGRQHKLVWARAIYSESVGCYSPINPHAACQTWGTCDEAQCSQAERAGSLVTAFRVYGCDDILHCTLSHDEEVAPESHVINTLRCRDVFMGNDKINSQRCSGPFFTKLHKLLYRRVSIVDYVGNPALLVERQCTWIVDVQTDKLLATGWGCDRWSVAASAEETDQLRLAGIIPTRHNSRSGLIDPSHVVVVSTSCPGQSPWEVSWPIELQSHDKKPTTLFSHDGSCLAILHSEPRRPKLPSIIRAIDGGVVREGAEVDNGDPNEQTTSKVCMTRDLGIVVLVVTNKALRTAEIVVYDTYSGRRCASSMRNESNCKVQLSEDRRWLLGQEWADGGIALVTWLVRITDYPTLHQDENLTSGSKQIGRRLSRLGSSLCPRALSPSHST